MFKKKLSWRNETRKQCMLYVRKLWKQDTILIKVPSGFLGGAKYGGIF